MIGVQLRGRLGNQLFQYAFAYATAKKLGTRFYMDSSYQKWILSKYFENTHHHFSWLDRYLFNIEGFRNFFRTFLTFRFYSNVKRAFGLKEVEISDQISPDQEQLKLADNTYYIGYFQSEEFFREHKQEIIELFSVRKKFEKPFKAIFNRLPQESKRIVVHVRRTDYLNYGMQLPTNYYHNAIASIDKEENFYLFITDDYEFVKTEFSYLKNSYISSASEIVDFQLMMNADICIISNSTFSWWAAYLNVNKAAVLAPENWFTDTAQIASPSTILLKNWSLINYSA